MMSVLTAATTVGGKPFHSEKKYVTDENKFYPMPRPGIEPGPSA